jgi:hypothetical protein
MHVGITRWLCSRVWCTPTNNLDPAHRQYAFTTHTHLREQNQLSRIPFPNSILPFPAVSFTNKHPILAPRQLLPQVWTCWGVFPSWHIRRNPSFRHEPHPQSLCLPAAFLHGAAESGPLRNCRFRLIRWSGRVDTMLTLCGDC